MKKLILLSLCIITSISFSCAQSVKVVELTDEAFEALLDASDDQDRLLAGNTPIVLDFHATWCGPCKAFSPIYEASAAELKGKVNFYKVDIDKCPQLKELFEIKVVPTVAFIPVSGEPTIIEGAPATKEEFVQTVEEILLKK